MVGAVEFTEDPAEETYGSYTETNEEELYSEYSFSANKHSIRAYEQMVDEPWLDEPLKEIIETRLEDLLEG